MEPFHLDKQAQEYCVRDSLIKINAITNSPVIRQKARISKQVFQENKARQIFRKHFLPPVSVSVRSRGLEMFVFRKIGVLCFLETPVLRFALFALLPTICQFSKYA